MRRFINKMSRMARDLYGEDIAALNKDIAEMLAAKARTKAAGMGGVYAKGAPAIVGAGTVKAGRVRVKATGGYRFAPVAFWGTKRRTGWYAARRFEGSGREQHPYWVGNMFDVGVKGQGPYAINDAIAENIDELLELWEQRLQEIINR